MIDSTRVASLEGNTQRRLEKNGYVMVKLSSNSRSTTVNHYNT